MLPYQQVRIFRFIFYFFPDFESISCLEWTRTFKTEDGILDCWLPKNRVPCIFCLLHLLMRLASKSTSFLRNESIVSWLRDSDDINSTRPISERAIVKTLLHTCTDSAGVCVCVCLHECVSPCGLFQGDVCAVLLMNAIEPILGQRQDNLFLLANTFTDGCTTCDNNQRWPE